MRPFFSSQSTIHLPLVSIDDLDFEQLQMQSDMTKLTLSQILIQSETIGDHHNLTKNRRNMTQPTIHWHSFPWESNRRFQQKQRIFQSISTRILVDFYVQIQLSGADCGHRVSVWIGISNLRQGQASLTIKVVEANTHVRTTQLEFNQSSLQCGHHDHPMVTFV